MPPESQNNFRPANNPLPLELPRKHTRLILLIVAVFLVGILAIGYFWYQNKQTPVPVKSQNLTVASSTNEFADWKTYTNEEYGFEFKYPNDWILEADRDGVSLDSPENFRNPNRRIEILIAYDKNLNNLNAKQYYDGVNGIKAFDNPTEDREVIVGNQKAYELYPTTGEFPGELVIIPKEQIFIRFDTVLIKENTDVVLSQILSTFKFISTSTKAINTTNWKTYRNDKYKFEVKYPTNTNYLENWGVEGGFQLMILNKDNSVLFEVHVIDGAFINDVIKTNSNLPDYTNRAYGVSPSEQTLLSNNTAYLYKFPFGDNPDFVGSPATNIVTNFKGNIYSVDFSGDLNVDDLEEKILSTFKFLQ